MPTQGVAPRRARPPRSLRRMASPVAAAGPRGAAAPPCAAVDSPWTPHGQRLDTSWTAAGHLVDSGWTPRGQRLDSAGLRFSGALALPAERAQVDAMALEQPPQRAPREAQAPGRAAQIAVLLLH